MRKRGGRRSRRRRPIEVSAIPAARERKEKTGLAGANPSVASPTNGGIGSHDIVARASEGGKPRKAGSAARESAGEWRERERRMAAAAADRRRRRRRTLIRSPLLFLLSGATNGSVQRSSPERHLARGRCSATMMRVEARRSGQPPSPHQRSFLPSRGPAFGDDDG